MNKLTQCRHIWPVNEHAGARPTQWPGWPDNKKFALVLTHDVERKHGQKKCSALMSLEKELGFVSSYNFVPLRYADDPALRTRLVSEGFEIGVHDLKHDGKLFNSQETFERGAPSINRYLKAWNARGFRAGAMHHNLQWIKSLNIDYDLSTFDTDPFEPQADGVSTIFPYWISDSGDKKCYLEMPYTLPQDFTLFIIMQERVIDIWKKKLAWIVEKGGMALVNTHPDYINFTQKKETIEEYPVGLYSQFLNYVKDAYPGQYWNALPSQVVQFMKEKC